MKVFSIVLQNVSVGLELLSTFSRLSTLAPEWVLHSKSRSKANFDWFNNYHHESDFNVKLRYVFDNLLPPHKVLVEQASSTPGSLNPRTIDYFLACTPRMQGSLRALAGTICYKKNQQISKKILNTSQHTLTTGPLGQNQKKKEKRQRVQN